MTFPPTCLRLASSWSIIPIEVVNTICPNWRQGRRLRVHISISFTLISKRGEMQPHLFRRPFRSTTTFPERWSSITVISPMYPIPQFLISLLTLLLHALKELQKHLGTRTNKNLTLTTLLSVGNGLKSVGEDIHQHGCSKRQLEVHSKNANSMLHDQFRTIISQFQYIPRVRLRKWKEIWKTSGSEEDWSRDQKAGNITWILKSDRSVIEECNLNSTSFKLTWNHSLHAMNIIITTYAVIETKIRLMSIIVCIHHL